MKDAKLTPAQLRAVAHIQESATLAGRDLRRIARLAAENNLAISVAAELAQLTAIYRTTRALVLDHLRARAEERAHVDGLNLEQRAAA